MCVCLFVILILFIFVHMFGEKRDEKFKLILSGCVYQTIYIDVYLSKIIVATVCTIDYSGGGEGKQSLVLDNI